jgi:serine O-acetyltransferase
VDYLREDIKRYFRKNDGLLSKTKKIILTQGIWATIVYRAGSWCHQNKSQIWPRIILPFLTVFKKMVEIMTGIDLPFTARIGKGLYIGHFGCIILGSKTVMGEYCNISNENTIGQAGRNGIQKTPVIGNRVYIAPGAKIFGGITIGDNVAIGANSVVTIDLPDNAVAVGIPAKIINFKGSQDFIVTNK